MSQAPTNAPKSVPPITAQESHGSSSNLIAVCFSIGAFLVAALGLVVITTQDNAGSSAQVATAAAPVAAVASVAGPVVVEGDIGGGQVGRGPAAKDSGATAATPTRTRATGVRESVRR